MEKDKINLALLWTKYISNITSVNDLVLGLDKKRFNAIFIYLSGYGVDKNLIEKAGYEVFYLSNIERINTFRFSILFRLVRILKEHNVDILHCHRYKPSFYGTLAGMFAKTPVILSHVHGLGRTRNIRRKLLNFFLFKKVNRIIGCAQSVKEDVLKNNPTIEPEKVIALENSVDFERFANVSTSKEDAKQMLGLPSDALVFGTVARFGLYKGHSFLISAFERVKKQVPLAHLILVGDGPLKEEIQQQVAEAGLDESVHFLGRRDDIPKLLRAIDVFVLPSIGSEGMPLVILEAMVAGVPCIASLLSGIPEVINNGDVGFLVPPGDSAVLAQVMISAANMPKDKLEELTKKAQNRVRHFYSHDVVVKKLENIYKTEVTHYYESNRRQKSNV